MSEKFPYLARQISGDIARYFGYGIDSVYEKDAEFIDFLSRISLDDPLWREESEWLDMLGTVLGCPRPYIALPTPREAFTFDTFPRVLDEQQQKELGFSDGVYSMTAQGGKLDDWLKNTPSQPISNAEYIDYIKAFTRSKQAHSIKDICDIVEALIGETAMPEGYKVYFRYTENYKNDIVVELSMSLFDYAEPLQYGFNSIFTTSPIVSVSISTDF